MSGAAGKSVLEPPPVTRSDLSDGSLRQGPWLGRLGRGSRCHGPLRLVRDTAAVEVSLRKIPEHE
jgi:hypothetical protein